MTATTWTGDFLDAMRQACDPPADSVIEELFQDDSLGAVNSLMATLVRNDDVPDRGLPACVRGFLDSTDDLPEWADRERIRRGEEFFGTQGPSIVLAYTCASLPAEYAGRRGVQVIYLTARLYSDPVRRVAETSQMILDVMAPGGLDARGRGLRDAQKVRLLHAALRHLLSHSGKWNPDWGRPINQEDLAGTLLTISVTVLEALAKLGVTVSPQEADAYLHAWNVVGHMMGIDGRLLPDTIEEATRLVRIISQRQWQSCPEGRELTAALIEAIEHLIPGTMFDGLPSYLIRFFGSEELCDILGVAGPRHSSLFGGPLRLFASEADAIADNVSPVRRASSVFSRHLLEGLGWLGRGGHRAPFSVPQELASRWNVRTPADWLR